MQEVLREVARGLAADRTPKAIDENIESRTERAVAVMEKLGGVAISEKVDDKLLLQSGSGCPFSDSMVEHPEVCRRRNAFVGNHGSRSARALQARRRSALRF